MVLKDVSKRTAEDLIKYLYNGEVKIESKNLNDFLHAANTLEIKGLTDINHSQQSDSFDASQSRSSSSLDGIQYQSTHSNHPLASTSSLNEINSNPTCSNGLNELQTLIDEFDSGAWVDYEDTYNSNDLDHSMETNNPEMTHEGDVNVENLKQHNNDASVGKANEKYQSDPQGEQDIDFVSVMAPKRARRNNGEYQ